MQAPHTKIEIGQAAYGKEGVRVLTWTRTGALDAVRDAVLGVRVEGDFLESYRTGQNAAILPSDTLRRHALAEADAEPDCPVEVLLARIAARVLAANPALGSALATAEVRHWERLGDHSFVLRPWRSTAEARLARSAADRLGGGLRGLDLLSTTGSGFTGFMRDPLTTQDEAADRPLCGTLDADWTYLAGARPPAGLTERIVGRLSTAFADRPSNAVQQLLTELGGEVLEATPELASIALHFESVPVAPIPDLLAAASTGNAHEIGLGPRGVTDVLLRRA